MSGPDQRKLYWQVTAAVALACLVNPFHIHALLAPLELYLTEYPALQSYNLNGSIRHSLVHDKSSRTSSAGAIGQIEDAGK